MNQKNILFSIKGVAVICLLSFLISSFSVALSAVVFEYDTVKDETNHLWEEPNFDDPESYAYSLAFVGDTQCLMIGDRLKGTNNMERLFKYIAETAAEKKLKHVSVLGDITEVGYWNDYNMANLASSQPLVTEEWAIAQKAIFQMNGKVAYNLCRGNHDDYMMNDYFNVDAFTSQYDGCGGFYTDPEAYHPNGGRNNSASNYTGAAVGKKLNPTGAIYWSAKTGEVQTETITNSWRTMEISGTKYLFITVDYNPTENVAKWVDETLAKYPDHKAIISTHSYMKASGVLTVDETGETKYPTPYGGKKMWDDIYSKHANVFMILCGHVSGADIPTYRISDGVNGNKVYQFVINPQFIDYKEPRKSGESGIGTQDTGLVMYMNFSEDGKTISMNYYSTLLNKFLKGADYRVDLETGKITGGLAGDGKSSVDGIIDEDEYRNVMRKKVPVLWTDEDWLAESTAPKSDEKGIKSVDFYYDYDDDYIYLALRYTTMDSGVTYRTNQSVRIGIDPENPNHLIEIKYMGQQGVMNYYENLYFTTENGPGIYKLKGDGSTDQNGNKVIYGDVVQKAYKRRTDIEGKTVYIANNLYEDLGKKLGDKVVPYIECVEFQISKEALAKAFNTEFNTDKFTKEGVESLLITWGLKPFMRTGSGSGDFAGAALWVGTKLKSYEKNDYNAGIKDNDSGIPFDYAPTVLTVACVDADKDHKCDDGCGKTFGEHSDANNDQICDYGCAQSIESFVTTASQATATGEVKEEKKGCKAMLSLASVIWITVLVGSAVVLDRKK